MEGQLTIQNYKSYTKEDQKVWSSLYKSNLDLLNREEKLNKEFIQNLSKLKLKKGEIPNFENLNKVLKPLSGFEVIVVTSEVNNSILFHLLKNRKFPVNGTLPNLFKDVFGNVPFLLNKSYGDEIVILAINALQNVSMHDEYRVQLNNLIRNSIVLNETNTTSTEAN